MQAWGANTSAHACPKLRQGSPAGSPPRSGSGKYSGDSASTTCRCSPCPPPAGAAAASPLHPSAAGGGGGGGGTSSPPSAPSSAARCCSCCGQCNSIRPWERSSRRHPPSCQQSYEASRGGRPAVPGTAVGDSGAAAAAVPRVLRLVLGCCCCGCSPPCSCCGCCCSPRERTAYFCSRCCLARSVIMRGSRGFSKHTTTLPDSCCCCCCSPACSPPAPAAAAGGSCWMVTGISQAGTPSSMGVLTMAAKAEADRQNSGCAAPSAAGAAAARSSCACCACCASSASSGSSASGGTSALRYTSPLPPLALPAPPGGASTTQGR